MRDMTAEVLGIEQVAIDGNFFELGGHSLLATQLARNVRAEFAVDLPLRVIFEAPTVSELAAYVSAQLAGGSRSELPPIEYVKVESQRTLSFAQERFWFLDQLTPGNTAYHLCYALRIAGRLDVGALNRGICAVLTRHEILRTIFVSQDGIPAGVVMNIRRADVPFIDLEALSPESQQRQVDVLLEAEATTPFELSRTPAIRFKLMRCHPDVHLFFITAHHIVSDGLSEGILVKELTAAYCSAVQSTPIGLPDLPVQYSDFARWQREWLNEDLLKPQLEFWREQLSPFPEPLALPFTRTLSRNQNLPVEQTTFEIAGALYTNLRAAAKKQRATLYMVLLAALDVLLHRYSGQSDIVVGTPVAGRNLRELEPLIGLFVNTVLLRTTIEARATFKEVLDEVRETCIQAFMHQDIPFEKLVEQLHPGRDSVRSPLFQVLFALQQETPICLVSDGLRIEQIKTNPGGAKFDLIVSVTEKSHGLKVRFEYNSDRLCQPVIQKMSQLYEAILRVIATNLDCQLGGSPRFCRQILRNSGGGTGRGGSLRRLEV